MNIDQYFPPRRHRPRGYGGVRLLLSTLLLVSVCVVVAEPEAVLRGGRALLDLGVALVLKS
ncbi:hypothetical protein E4T66_02225 [Sinimarinibacterium sp. CAU 1509]|uniref:hypothetical protein n=1 Tax=Sinimarinibacterium sp. CAU 1509 TaxID=2562283 RepID=UPI0010AC9DA1|nr:hypothetical protein [Sinimarinibacterium sp. CAU 1509]TJY65060.1 hypothetical protein E4T66_02225 [Sinimarinibacterium sp. CAU 1509]